MTTTAIIILSALLGASLCVNLAASVRRKRLALTITRLKGQKRESDTERESSKVKFRIFTITKGRFAVYRVSYTTDGSPLYHTLIKTFDTDDAEYNRNEAEGLVDNLGKELCYDWR